MKKEFRVEYSKSLLLMDNSSVTFEGIGAMSGFKSNSNFYSSFKEITGKTPLEWKNDFDQSN